MSISGANIDVRVALASVFTYAIPLNIWVYASISFTPTSQVLYLFSSQVKSTSILSTILTSPVTISLNIQDIYLRDLHILANAAQITNFIPYMSKPLYPSMYQTPEVAAYIPCMSLDSLSNVIGFTRYPAGITFPGNLPSNQPGSDPSINF